MFKIVNMKLIIKIIVIFFFSLTTLVNSNENYFIEAKELFKKEKYKDSKFLFQRSIAFDPKHSKSYLYLAKIYKVEENENEELKNLNTTLLLDSNNEEATYLLIEIELKRSNFSKVKELRNKLESICSLFCDKIGPINKRLDDIEAKNES
jgi:tetratricopeptide (TPR) repeat protein|tara:strand:- start:72 stop:521 length:450 start_codon:yes stop_codon:yes gene_type:complete